MFSIFFSFILIDYYIKYGHKYYFIDNESTLFFRVIGVGVACSLTCLRGMSWYTSCDYGMGKCMPPTTCSSRAPFLFPLQFYLISNSYFCKFSSTINIYVLHSIIQISLIFTNISLILYQPHSHKYVIIIARK